MSAFIHTKHYSSCNSYLLRKFRHKASWTWQQSEFWSILTTIFSYFKAFTLVILLRHDPQLLSSCIEMPSIFVLLKTSIFRRNVTSKTVNTTVAALCVNVCMLGSNILSEKDINLIFVDIVSVHCQRLHSLDINIWNGMKFTVVTYWFKDVWSTEQLMFLHFCKKTENMSNLTYQVTQTAP